MPTKQKILVLIVWLPAAVLLAALTVRVRAGTGQLDADTYWSGVVSAMRSVPLTALMRRLHAIQGTIVAVAILCFAAALAWRRRWPSLGLLVAMVPLGMLANSGLKLLVGRPRPTLQGVVGSHGFAYPSGHTAAITLFCGYLVILTFRSTTRWAWRIAALAGALAAVSAVAFSRVYLGVHQPSDVVAAVLLGVAWLGLCLSSTQWVHREGRSATR